MKFRRIAVFMLSCLLFAISGLTPAAFAETPLPDGAVKGLPERLAALDDEGNAVNSETGEYYFRVENMQIGEIYSKNVQLMNLRDDYSYHIYFCAEPIRKSGDIDLEKYCSCRFLLDGEVFYQGDVYGKGNIDLTQYYDTGKYKPGDSHVLRCEIKLNGYEIDKSIDYGWKMVDVEGTHVLREPEGEGEAYGEIEFKWVFCAAVDPKDIEQNNGGGTPNTGILLKDGMLWLIGIAAVGVMILALLILLKKAKKDKKQ